MAIPTKVNLFPPSISITSFKFPQGARPAKIAAALQQGTTALSKPLNSWESRNPSKAYQQRLKRYQAITSSREISGGKEFLTSLANTYNLNKIQQEEGLKFNGVSELNFQALPPQQAIKPIDGCPGLAIMLRPISAIAEEPLYTDVSETNIDPRTVQFSGALALRDVQRWTDVKAEFGKYLIGGFIGAPENVEKFPSSRSLSSIIEQLNFSTFRIEGDTPVVRCLGVFPIAPNGEFLMQIAPLLFMGEGEHKDWLFTIISQNKMSAYSIYLNSPERKFGSEESDHAELLMPQEPDSANSKIVKNNNWSVRYLPDMTNIEKLFVDPDSSGHMIIIASPIEGPKDPQRERTLFSDSFWRSSTFGGETMKGGYGLGSVNYGRGNNSGTARITQKMPTFCSNKSSVIFHLYGIGAKPEQIPSVQSAIETKAFDRAFNGYSRYKFDLSSFFRK